MDGNGKEESRTDTFSDADTFAFAESDANSYTKAHTDANANTNTDAGTDGFRKTCRNCRGIRRQTDDPDREGCHQYRGGI